MSPNQKPRNRANNPPPERRVTSSTYTGSTMGYSAASSEIGESSTAGSDRNSYVAQDDRSMDDGNDGALKISKPRSSHRSHRSRNSGSFLLSGSTIQSSSETSTVVEANTASQLPQGQQGKVGSKAQERLHSKRRSNIGLGIAGSPLAANVTNAGVNSTDSGNNANENGDKRYESQEKVSPGLDVDSTQIINLALNLSESRKNAARRNISTPIAPLASAFGDGFASGSLRQHLQQQRRIPRNISPKPQRASTASPRVVTGQLASPLHSTFDPRPNEYQYQFSASTLARAEKARAQIELMAQYRRLLQFVPPLKPESSSLPKTPTSSRSDSVKETLGRQYNPLQYIRNRKIRARERKAIDGEAQGFADLEKVVKWVDQVSEGKCSGGNQGTHSMILPIFSPAAEQATSPHVSSPKPVNGKSPTVTAKVKRPRVDWDTNPADMLADLFWLEQDDNKKIVEDRFGKRVFPQNIDIQRPISKSEEPEHQSSPETNKAMSPNLRIDTKFPEFKSMKAGADKHDSATDRVRHRIRDATRIHHNGTRETRQFLRARSKSDSDSSETDSARHSGYRRNGSAEAHDRGVDILNKQMMELLAKEARGDGWKGQDSKETQPSIRSIESETSAARDELDRSRNSLDNRSTSGSVVAIKESRSKRDSVISSGRPSLEVPGRNGRQSLDILQSANGQLLPSAITGDLTPQRHSSPSRNPLAKVRSKINPFEHIRTHSRGRAATDAAVFLNSSEQTLENVDAVEQRPRSTSPQKKTTSRPTADGEKSSRRGSFRKGKTSEDSSGIRGLFKGRRAPVVAVNDILGRKDFQESSAHSGFSTDESDVDKGMDRGSRDSSVDPVKRRSGSPRSKEKPMYDLPTFTSQRERSAEPLTGNTSTGQRKSREERNQSQGQLLNTPRIDIHRVSPGSSPDISAEGFRSDSSVSEIGSQKNSSRVHRENSRLDGLSSIRGRRDSQWRGRQLSVEESEARRPSLEGKRQWSISDRGVSVHQGPMTKREIARVRALLLSSGIKAKEISRRAGETQYLHLSTEPAYKGIIDLAQDRVKPMPKHQLHIVAARILSDDIQLSKRVWQDSADTFCNTTVQDLVSRLDGLKGTIQESLTPMARKAADEADEVSKDLVTSQTLKVKRITDAMDTMLRRRRRKFRWLRRAGWVLVEWGLVGVMWFAWLIVVFLKIFTSIGRAVTATTRWLLWL